MASSSGKTLWFRALCKASERSRATEAAPTHREDLATLQAVEAYLAQRHEGLSFPDWLEERFDREMGSQRSRWLASDTVNTALVYNAFLVGDVFLTPDTLLYAGALHFLVVTPAMLAIAWLFRKTPRLAWRDGLAAALPILMSAQILAIYALSRAETAPHYLYFVLMVSICSNTSLRLGYRSARWATLATFGMTVVTLIATHRMPIAIAGMQCVSLALCSGVTLEGNFGRERQYRLSYVNALRDRLRVAATDGEARRDALTGLSNRRRLDEASAAIWSSRDPAPALVSAILFDVDRFKSFNDIYGHQAGDSCLRRIAACALSELRGADDIAVRYGGEEFMLVLPHARLDEAVAAAERLRMAIADLGILHEGEGAQGVVTASFGVASVIPPESSFEALTAAADAALYEAKRAGRNRVGVAPVNSRPARAA